MLLVLLAIFPKVNAGQILPDEGQMTQEISHSKSVRETYEANSRTEDANVISIVASPPEIQLDTSQQSIQVKSEIANVIPQTIIHKISHGATVHVEEPSPNIYLVSQPINVNYMRNSMDSEVKLDEKNAVDTLVRISLNRERQSTKKPLHRKTTKRTSQKPVHRRTAQPTQKPIHKKTTKKPARKSVHTKIVKKSKTMSHSANMKLSKSKNLKIKAKGKSKVKFYGRLRACGHVEKHGKLAENSGKGKVPLNIRIEEHTKIDVLDGSRLHMPFVSRPVNVENPVRPVNVDVNVDVEPRSRPLMRSIYSEMRHTAAHRHTHSHRISKPMRSIYSKMRHNAAHRHIHSHRMNKRPFYSRMRHIALHTYTNRRQSTRYTTKRRVTLKRTTRRPTTGIAAGTVKLTYDVWLKFGGCEYMVRKNAKNYDDAEATCRRHGAHLVSIHSEAENNFIHKITSTGSGVKTFLEFVYIGLRMNSRNEWEWIDGSPLNYKKWAKYQPDFPEKEKCGQFHQEPAKLYDVQDYHWNSISCDRTMKFYVCKKCKGSHHHKIKISHHHQKSHRRRCCCSCHSCEDMCKEKCDKSHKREHKPSPAQPFKPARQIAVFPGQAE